MMTTFQIPHWKCITEQLFHFCFYAFIFCNFRNSKNKIKIQTYNFCFNLSWIELLVDPFLYETKWSCITSIGKLNAQETHDFACTPARETSVNIHKHETCEEKLCSCLQDTEGKRDRTLHHRILSPRGHEATPVWVKLTFELRHYVQSSFTYKLCKTFVNYFKFTALFVHKCLQNVIIMFYQHIEKTVILQSNTS